MNFGEFNNWGFRNAARQCHRPEGLAANVCLRHTRNGLYFIRINSFLFKSNLIVADALSNYTTMIESEDAKDSH